MRIQSLGHVGSSDYGGAYLSLPSPTISMEGNAMKITHSLPIQSQTIDGAHKKSKQSQQTVPHETYMQSTKANSARHCSLLVM